MALSKYPVTSEKGNTYKVDVWIDDLGDCIVEVFIEYKGLFGRKKFKHVSGGIFDSRYDIKKWNYNFVDMAKNEVQRYERIIDAENEHLLKLEKAVNKFNEWDGVIKS